ncbi:MAG: ankyrin repeat domain-containing protein [Candidatus Hydrogenedentes bacterium]|nr:ankyrin repeat domain-containing protein [Candidatus Hydrogenedentota bacterium]
MRAILVVVACMGTLAVSVSCSGRDPLPKKDYESIFEAAVEGDWSGVKDCIRVFGEDINHADENGDTVLHYAAEGGNEEVIRGLIELGAQIDAKNIDDMTPLQVAREAGHEKAAKLLEELGATE